MAQTRTRSSRGSSRRKTTSATKKDSGPLTASEATEFARRSLETSMEGLATAAGTDLILGDTASSAVGQSDITDELTRGGPAFGSFVDSVGQAVAKAQAALDATLVQTAEALSKAEVNVLAAYEQQLNDDDGTMEKGNPIFAKIPLITMIPPTAYAWEHVQLKANMNVSEFNSANGFNIQGKSSSFSAGARAGYSMFGFGASGSVNTSSSSYSAAGSSSYAQDYAAGQLELDALLEPRRDIRAPTPLTLKLGPTILLSVASRDFVDATDAVTTDPTKVVARKVVLEVTLRKRQGDPNSGKALQFSIDQQNIDFKADPANATTDANGKIKINLWRRGSAAELNASVQIRVNVWFGLVNEAVGIAI